MVDKLDEDKNDNKRDDGNKNARKLLGMALSFYREHYALLALAVYIAGTIILCMRNKIVGLPFTTISIVQYAIIVFYVFIFITPVIIIDRIEIQLAKRRKNCAFRQTLKTYWQQIGKIMLQVGLAEVLLLSCLVQNVVLASIIVAITYYLASTLPNIIGEKIGRLLKYSVQFCMCVVVVMFIPMSLGGMRSYKVEFCLNDSVAAESCKTYFYYGEFNGLYQFRDDETVILMPTDAGFIRYHKDALDSFTPPSATD